MAVNRSPLSGMWITCVLTIVHLLSWHTVSSASIKQKLQSPDSHQAKENLGSDQLIKISSLISLGQNIGQDQDGDLWSDGSDPFSDEDQGADLWSDGSPSDPENFQDQDGDLSSDV